MAVITFLSDFGLADCYVGVCHAVIAAVAPTATVVDLTHTVAPLDVRDGATTLADCVAAAPAAVHLAVVDPDADDRPGVAVVCGDAVLVGPDNGLLLPAADALGGVEAAYQLTEARWHRTPVSPVFRGRDVFAPVAAHLACGASARDLGPGIDRGRLRRLPSVDARVAHRRIDAPVRHVDCYGNIQLAVTPDDLRRAGLDGGRPVRLRAGHEPVDVRRVASFSDLGAGELGIVEDSFGWLAVVAGAAAAAQRLAVDRCDTVRLGDG